MLMMLKQKDFHIKNKNRYIKNTKMTENNYTKLQYDITKRSKIKKFYEKK